MNFHLAIRTSPKGEGETFIGTCAYCGKEGLTAEDVRTDPCPQFPTTGVTHHEAHRQGAPKKSRGRIPRPSRRMRETGPPGRE